MPWQCYAKPARFNGQVCGWQNETHELYQGLVVCAYCGCTKIASDLRRKAAEFDEPMKLPALSAARSRT